MHDTISSVMLVSSIISAGIGFDGSFNDEKNSVTRVILSSGR
jgi:hypothetical protein